MANKALVGIVGPSGTGKSTSLRNLNPETTIILDLERKGFPFRGFEKFTVKPIGDVATFDKELAAAIEFFKAKGTEGVVVVESITKYFELLLKLAQQSQKGYEIYNFYNRCVGSMLERCKNDHAIVVFTAIDEIVKIPQADGTEQSQRRIYTKGKEWEGKIEKELLVVFFTEIKKTQNGNITYHFATNTDGVTSAKSPMEMFKERLVDNDLAACLKAARDYYLTPTN